MTNPGKKNLRVFEPFVRKFFYGKSVLLLGSAPSVINLKPEFMESFDIIVRVNNYRNFNSCTRTDVFYSMMGGSIKKTCAELKKDGVKFIFCKNPFANVQVLNSDGSINYLESQDMRKVYLVRKHWFELPYYIQSEKNWRWITAKIGKICTTGLAALVDIVRYLPNRVHMAGYDFFSSGMHNIDIPSHFKPWPKHHDFKAEMLFVRHFMKSHPFITCDETMQRIFARPEKFPKIGDKPE